MDVAPSDEYFDRMLCSEDQQTWWWPRRGPKPTAQGAGQRIREYHRHYHGELPEPWQAWEEAKFTITEVWMTATGQEPGCMDEVEHPITRDSFPYWRIELNLS